MYGDELRLKQVLINLVKNALKFTIRGMIKIVMAYDETDGKLFVHVADNGKGISENEIPKLFTQFGKLKRTAKMNHEGIGLGLLICDKLVRANGGAICVYSDGPEKGATFCFSMKMRLNDEVEPTNEELRTQRRANRKRKIVSSSRKLETVLEEEPSMIDTSTQKVGKHEIDAAFGPIQHASQINPVESGTNVETQRQGLLLIDIEEESKNKNVDGDSESVSDDSFDEMTKN